MELTAEIAAYLTLARLNIADTLTITRGYLANWLQAVVINEDIKQDAIKISDRLVEIYTQAIEPAQAA